MKRHTVENIMIMAVATLFTTGCLVTRQEVRNTVKSDPLTADQQKKANIEIRYQEQEELLRQMNGRIEVLENSMNILSADKSGAHIEHQSDKKALVERLKIYEETLSKLDAQQNILTQKIEALHASAAPAKSSSKSSAEGSKNSFDQAEDGCGLGRRGGAGGDCAIARVPGVSDLAFYKREGMMKGL